MVSFISGHKNAQHEAAENGGEETLLLEMKYFYIMYL
jgi:hypothetical protein